MSLQSPAPVFIFANGELGTYVTLKRACDDPHHNFQKIRNQRLWMEREIRLRAVNPPTQNGTTTKH